MKKRIETWFNVNELSEVAENIRKGLGLGKEKFCMICGGYSLSTYNRILKRDPSLSQKTVNNFAFYMARYMVSYENDKAITFWSDVYGIDYDRYKRLR